MIRTVISLEEEEKIWLDKMARAEHISMAAVIRKAIHEFQKKNTLTAATNFDKLLEKTRGIWGAKDDGLKYQNKLRAEWDK